MSSEKSKDLQRQMTTNLMKALPHGSMEYSMTWKPQITPAQRLICRLVASARRTSVSDCFGWPTPDAYKGRGGAQDPEKRRAGGHQVLLQDVASGWAFPGATDWKGSSQEGQRRGQLSEHALLAGWPTTRAEDAESAGARKGRGVNDTLTAVARVSGYPTPTPTELGNTLEQYQDMKANMKSGSRTAITHLNIAAQAMGWTSPTYKDGASAGSRNTASSKANPGLSLTDQARGDSGTGRSGSAASKAKRGVLNEGLSRWLMGFPAEWSSCGVMGTRLYRRLPRNLSKRG